MRTRRPAKAVTAAAIAALAVAMPASIVIGQSPTPRERVLQYLERAPHIEPGRGLAGVRVGMPLRAVVERWGPPLRSDRKGFFERTTTLVYKPGIDTWVRIRGDRSVEEIGIEGRNRLTTREGIGFGSPRNQVSMVYGQPGESGANEATYPERGITFVFRSGTVFQMRIFAPRSRTDS